MRRRSCTRCGASGCSRSRSRSSSSTRMWTCTTTTDVFFRVTANVDPKRDVLITEGPLDHLDHAPGRQFYGGKLGIDATHKLPEEDARPWPEEIVMSDEIRDLVRAGEYGLDAMTASRHLPSAPVVSAWLNHAQVRLERSRTRHSARPRPELVADRLRHRGGVPAARSRDQLDHRGDRGGARDRLRLPLGTRSDAGRARGRAGDRAGDTRGRRTGSRRAGCRGGCEGERAAPGVLALALPQRVDVRPRRRDRRDRDASRARLHRSALVHEHRGGRGRPRPDRQLPGGRVRHRLVPREPEAGRGQPSHRVRSEQRS